MSRPGYMDRRDRRETREMARRSVRLFIYIYIAVSYNMCSSCEMQIVNLSDTPCKLNPEVGVEMHRRCVTVKEWTRY